MSLPTGYTELEYIQSSGTQYIDTGYRAISENYRIKCNIYFDRIVNNTVPFGGGASTDIISALLRDNVSSSEVRFYVGSGRISGTNVEVSVGVNYELECWANNGNFTVILNGASCSGNYSGTVNKDYTLALFANNVSGNASAFSSVRISKFQIYDNDVLVRDFVPCKNSSGTAGLYDTVNSVFYKNSGSGSFIEGAEASRVPDAPSNLTAHITGADVVLTWEADENADGYKIYRETELIGEIGEAQYRLTGLEKYTGHVFAVSAYNEYGESDKVSVSFYIDGVRPLSDLITDRTAADVTVRTKKGSYNASDMNRVSAAAEYVRGIIRSFGYTLPDGVKRRWAENDIPDAAELDRHLADVLSVDVLDYAAEKLILPQSMNRLTYEGANTIEKFLKMIGEAAERIPEAYIYSDEIYGGENY